MEKIYYCLALLPFWLLFYWHLWVVIYKLTNLDKEGNFLHLKAAEVKFKPLNWLLSGFLDCEICMETWLGAVLMAAIGFITQEPYFMLFSTLGASSNNIIKSLQR